MPRNQLVTCALCGKKYELGRTGTIRGCDVCTGVQRDRNGMIVETFVYLDDDQRTPREEIRHE